MTKSLTIRVFGKVQGVFFRQSTKEQADRLGVFGFAQNMPDNSVYIAIEGPATAVDDLVTWCHQGPPRAKVTQVLTENATPKGFTIFEIRK